ncbi:MAG: sialate O-acetylesterase [Rheinheimera sp.]|nr:sialate O-acetylesterase [Rheinheimera sp.]
MPKLFLSALFILFFAAPLQADIRLPKLISDHLVLQRDQPLPLWGYAAPGESVTLRLNNTAAGTVTADQNGRWQLTLPPQPAGGPHLLAFLGQNQLKVQDVYFGDVFVASGQSNMELPMARLAEAYPADLQNANYPLIRQFNVPQRYDFKAPQQDFPATQQDDPAGQWLVASPETIQHFSALAFYFARDLQQHSKVPIGIYNAALGGSPVESWLDEPTLRQFPDAYQLAQIYKSDRLIRDIEAADQVKNSRWYGDLAKNDAGLHAKTPWFSPALDDSVWADFQVPGYRKDNFTGVWWLRKTVHLTAAQAAQARILRLGSIVDAEEVYVNGSQIGNTTYMYPPRRYALPQGLLKAGDNLLAVRVTVTNGAQNRSGFIPDKPYWLGTDSNKFDLTGQWKMQTSSPARALPMDAFIRWKPLGLYNAMIAPLQTLPVKAVLWYQGESNVGAYQQYEQRFRAMIRQWRAQWQQPQLPVLYVQLANYLPKQPNPQQSSWAGLREAQAAVLTEPNTAMVVAIDTGEWNDIHPVDKRTLGSRMALAARALVYGENIAYRGPELHSLLRQGASLLLSFHNKEQGLVLKPGRAFAIAGADGKFIWAEVALEDGQIRLSHPQIPAPTQVRYAHADNPDAVLYNGIGLPASPFSASLSQ